LSICYVSAAATFGFLIFNYPRGKIFLGDGGAYLLGCIIALAGAMLILRNRHVSPWFPLALVVYPIWETLFSVLRRILLYGTKIGEPDAKHLHSLVYRRASRRWVRGRRQGDKMWRNALTTLPFWIACCILAVAAVKWSYETRAMQALAVTFIVGYSLIYRKLARLDATVSRKARPKSAVIAPTPARATEVGK